MIAARHTPGPWEQKIQSCGFCSICTVYGTDQGWVEIHAPNGSHTADVRAESTANARLIAAAPDLLEALKDALATIEDYLGYEHNGDPWTEDARSMGEMDVNDYKRDGRLAHARAVIAKATGGAA